jgi:hypothetical protein
MSPQIGVDGDIILDGVAYRIEPGSYGIVDASDWAPRGDTPGSSKSFSDLGLYQPDSQESWTRGLGYVWYEDVLGYLKTEGKVDASQAGMVQLGTAHTYSDGDAQAKKGGFTFGTAFYAWTYNGLRKFSGGSWADVWTDGELLGAFQNGQYIFILPTNTVRNGRILKSTTGAAETGAVASYTTAMTGADNDIKLTAMEYGTAGNSITFAYTIGAPTSTPIVTVTVNAISVQVQAGVSTANQVITALNASTAAMNLVTVALAAGNNGTGTIPGVLTATNLAGGSGTAVWTKAGVDANARNFYKFALHNGFHYLSEYGTNYVHRASQTDLSDLEGGGALDADVIIVGPGTMPALHLMPFGEQLYAPRPDALYAIGQDQIARRVLDFSGEISYNNFKSIAVFNSRLIFPIQGQIYAWSGSKLEDITPGANADMSAYALTDTFPYTDIGDFNNFMPKGKFLYMTASTTYQINPITGLPALQQLLLKWNESGWHIVAEIAWDFPITFLANDSYNKRIWYHVWGSVAHATWYMQYDALTERPYPAFPTTGTHRLYFSRRHEGYKWVRKSAPAIKITGENLTTRRYILVEYALDGETTYHELGRVVSNGSTELRFPSKTGTVEFFWIGIRVQLVTDDAAQSPILTDLTLRYIMRPEFVPGWSFQIPAASFMRYGDRQSSLRSSEIKEKLIGVRSSAAPVTFIDVDGSEHLVNITSIRGQLAERSATGGVEGDALQYVFSVSLVDVGDTL